MSKPNRNDLAPIFVLGNPRSGTTLLRLMLTAHSKIGIPPECEFIVKLFPQYGHITHFSERDAQRFLKDCGGRVLDIAEMWEVALQDLSCNKEELVGLNYPEVCARLYVGYQKAKGLGISTYWGDKNNAFGNYIDILTFMYPRARFIHIVRDGRAVLNSYQKLRVDTSQKYAPVLPRESVSVGFRWSDMVNRIDRHLRRFAKDQFVVVRYEDILDRPEQEMQRICTFLGLDFETSMLDYHIFKKENSLEPANYSWKENTNNPIQVQFKDAWLKRLEPQDIKTFETVAFHVMKRHGYEPINSDAQKLSSRSLLAKRSEAYLRELLRRIRFCVVAFRTRISL